MSWRDDELRRRLSWLSPLALRFTHAEISAAPQRLFLKFEILSAQEFQDGMALDVTIDKFRTKDISAEHFKDAPLEVVWRDGALWSLSNRRLYVFRVARALGCCSVCPCKIMAREQDRVTNRWTAARQTV